MHTLFVDIKAFLSPTWGPVVCNCLCICLEESDSQLAKNVLLLVAFHGTVAEEDLTYLQNKHSCIILTYALLPPPRQPLTAWLYKEDENNTGYTCVVVMQGASSWSLESTRIPARSVYGWLLLNLDRTRMLTA